MPIEKQNVTCAICFEEKEEQLQAKLNCCSHTYCYDCIKQWTKDSENTCPQCKLEITKITFKDSDNVIQTEEVLDRRQGQPNMHEFICLDCNQQIRASDFRESPSNTN